jgi:hypothetical protein
MHLNGPPLMEAISSPMRTGAKTRRAHAGPLSGPAIPCIRSFGVGPQHVRQGGPHRQDQTGRQDTTVVIAHGARTIPVYAIRW